MWLVLGRLAHAAPSHLGAVLWSLVQALALDLLAYISLAVKHDEDKAFERVLNKPKRGLAEQALQKLRHAQQRLKCSLFEVAKKLMRPEYKALSAAQQKSLASFVSVISELRKDVSTKTPEEVLKAVVPRVYQNQGARAAGAAGKKASKPIPTS